MEFIRELMKKIFALLIVGGCLSLGFFFGRKCSRIESTNQFIDVNKVVSDTVIQRVSVIQYQPIEKQSIPGVPIVAYFPADTVYKTGDSIRIEVPTEAKIYRDSLYEVQISGYQPSLDWIRIYQETKYINTTNYIDRKVRFSVLGGVEYDFLNRCVVPQARLNLDLYKVQLNARFGIGYSLNQSQFVNGVTIGVDIPIYRTK